ncbi:hypothetical protein DFH06DRAFT_1307949 [Mycena polygramma]|nr:hypothetical protein DFH06DRAFT_1307949 [Mycena polygramma]
MQIQLKPSALLLVLAMRVASRAVSSRSAVHVSQRSVTEDCTLQGNAAGWAPGCNSAQARRRRQVFDSAESKRELEARNVVCNTTPDLNAAWNVGWRGGFNEAFNMCSN